MNDSTQVHVIGGGLAGLVAARTLTQRGHDCVVHEAAPGPGGRARTDERHGYRFNRGPHAFYTGGPGAEILGRLGVHPRGAAPSVKGTRMMRDRTTHVAPVSPGSLLRTSLLGWRAKRDLGALLARVQRLEPEAFASTTAAEWIASCTDDPDGARVLHSLVRLTTYCNAPDDLSADVAVTQIQLALDPGVRYLHGGWSQIVDDLRSHPTARIDTESRLTTLPDAPAVVVATGGPDAAAALLGTTAPASTTAEVSVLDLSLRRHPHHRVVLGLDEPIYMSDHGFPDAMTPSGRASVSLAQYLGPGDEPDRDRLRRFAVDAGIVDENVVDERYLHRMTAVSSIATAESGGLRGRPGVGVPGLTGVFVAGDWVGARGHLLDAVVCSAHEAALAAMHHVESRPVPR